MNSGLTDWEQAAGHSGHKDASSGTGGGHSG